MTAAVPAAQTPGIVRWHDGSGSTASRFKRIRLAVLVEVTLVTFVFCSRCRPNGWQLGAHVTPFLRQALLLSPSAHEEVGAQGCGRAPSVTPLTSGSVG